MIRKKKLFVKPRKAYEKSRIEEENRLMEKYGLKNKREIWKAASRIKYYRRRAKALAKEPFEVQEVLFRKLREKGLKVNSIADVLDLKIENLLDRRLPTIVAKKGLANTVKQARQLTVHKKVLVDGRVVNVPSYIVSVDEENKISVKGNINLKKKDKKANHAGRDIKNNEEISGEDIENEK